MIPHLPTPAPTVPSPTMNCDTATAFSIDSGDCTACGEGFHTPNFLAGGDYDHSHHCTITPLSSGWLDVIDFHLESYFDDITVDGVEYDGTIGPHGVAVSTSSSISFHSDISTAYDGAHICLTPEPTLAPTTSPTLAPSPEPASSPGSGTTTSPTPGPVIVSTAVGLSGISCSQCT